MTDPRTAAIIRIVASLLLALGALALFLAGPRDGPAGGDEPPAAAGIRAAVSIDGGIDSVLASFGIPDRDIRKRSAGPGETGYTRTERRVRVGPDIVPVMVNAALSRMAHRYGARAVASENLRLNTVTIHLELGGAVIHTIILRVNPRAAGRSPAQGQTST